LRTRYQSSNLPHLMTPGAFRKLVLSLPGSHEEPHFDRTSFRVGKRIFATMTADGEEAMVPVRPLELCFAMLKSKPEIFFSYRGWTERNGSLGIRLAKADPGLLRQLLHEAWARIAPRRAAKKSG
jgi:hypothetical protein